MGPIGCQVAVIVMADYYYSSRLVSWECPAGRNRRAVGPIFALLGGSSRNQWNRWGGERGLQRKRCPLYLPRVRPQSQHGREPHWCAPLRRFKGRQRSIWPERPDKLRVSQGRCRFARPPVL